MADVNGLSATAGRRRGFSLVEIVLVLLIGARAGPALYTYLEATKKSLDAINAERPINQWRLLADFETLEAIRTQVNVYHAAHGEWPPSREAVAALLRAAPQFQCAGQDYTYEPASGAV